MIVLRMELLPLASLLLITLLNAASGCGRTALHPRYHHHHHSEESLSPSYSYRNKTAERSHHPNSIPLGEMYKRSVTDNSVDSSLSTSCRQTLCARSPTYPAFAIKQAVTNVGRILMSDDELDLQKKKFIDPTVRRYFFSLQRYIPNYDVSEPDGCDHYLNVFLPEEGYSSDDERAYYIVNLKSYRQRIESIVCTSPGEICYNSFLRSTCRQAYRVEKLLVLPLNSQFDISDFRVKKFKVPNGCTCSVV